MVDTLTEDRHALEDLVRAEHAEKEFFLRKLMEANKELHGLPSGIPPPPPFTIILFVSVSSLPKEKKAEELDMSEFVTLNEKDKTEAFMRVNSKIRALKVKVKVLQVHYPLPT